MGKKPDAIYNEIVAHRQRMAGKREDLQERIASDLRGVKDRVGERSPDAVSNFGDRVSAHPLSYLVGGFGTGVLAGMVTPGLSMAGSHNNGDGRRNGHQSDEGGGRISGLTTALSGTMVSALDDAVRPLMRDVFAGFKGDDRPPSRRDGSSSGRDGSGNGRDG